MIDEMVSLGLLMAMLGLLANNWVLVAVSLMLVVVCLEKKEGT